MKKITLWLFALFMSWQINSQVSVYTMTVEDGNYQQITGTTSTAIGDDGLQNNIDIGFPFYYGGVVYNNFSISTNGIIKLGVNPIPDSQHWTNNLNNNNATFRPVIAPFWDDLEINQAANGGKIEYSVSGTAPNRILSVNWINAIVRGTSSVNPNINFILKLHESSNIIEMEYSNPFSTTNSASASVGLNDMTSFLSVTPGSTFTTSITISNNSINATTLANLAGKKLVFTPPYCLPPANFTLNNVGFDFAEIGWDYSVSPAAIDYEYILSTTNTMPSNQTSGIFVEDVTLLLSDLNPSTQYYLFTRTNCNEDGFSNWSNPFIFSTQCNVIDNFPHIEHFDNYAVGNDTFPVCWSRPVTNTVGNFTFPSIDTQPSTGSAPNSLKFQSLTTTPTYAVTPQISEDINNIRLKFQLKREGSTSGTIEVGVMSDPLDISTFQSIHTISPTNNDFLPYNLLFDQSVVSGSNLYIAFKHTSQANNWFYWLDSVVIEILPNCPDVTGISVSNPTARTANVTWNALDGATSYEFGASTTMSPPENIFSSSTNNGTIEGLSPGTNYYVSVRSVCNGSYGSWVTINATFLTLCETITELPYLEDFSVFPNICWTKGKNGNLENGPATIGASNWDTDFRGNDTAAANKAVRINLDNSGDQEWYISPSIVIPSDDYEMRLEISMHQWNSMAAPTTAMSAGDFVQILISTEGNLNWQVLETFNLSNLLTTTPTYKKYLLSNYSGQTVKFAFRAQEGADNNRDIEVIIDNLEVKPLPSCPDIFGLTVSNIQATSAVVSWDELTIDGATGYEYFVSTTVTTPTSGTFTSEHSVTISDLLPLTTQYVFVRRVCGDEFGEWERITVNTPCLPATINNITSGEVCGQGIVTLSASSEGTLEWFANETGGTRLIEGQTFTTPLLTQTTSYWVSSRITGCVSPRVEVIATVNPAEPVTLSAANSTICRLESTDAITLTSDVNNYDQYDWSPSTTVSGNSIDGWVFTPSQSTTYTLTATQSIGDECVTKTQFVVEVKATPSDIISSSTSTCVNSVVHLVAEGGTLNNESIIGNGTQFTPLSDVTPSAFNNRYTTAKVQTIYTASELIAAGFTAGSIKSIAYNTSTNGSSLSNTNYTVKIGHFGTQNTFTTATFIDDSNFTTCFGPATYTRPNNVSGWKVINFTNDFVWDGQSNIIIQLFMNGVNSIDNARTQYTSVTGSVLSAVNTSQTLQSPTIRAEKFNIQMIAQSSTDMVWSPIDNLFTDEAATVSYDGLPATSVYFSSNNVGVNTITATATAESGCSVSGTFTVNVENTPVTPTAVSPQELNHGQTLADLVVNGTNLVWYSDADLTTEIPNTTLAVDGTTYYVTSEVGECSTDAASILVEVTLGNDKFDSSSLRVYPNPTKNIINVSYSNDISTIEIFNLVGQKINHIKVDNNSSEVDLSNLASGAYFLKINSNNVSKTIKVIKE